MSAFRKTGASLAIASSLFFAAACGLGGDGGGNEDSSSIGAGEYDVVAKEEVVNSIIVDGSISPIRQAGISTTLQVPVEKIHVGVGDKVKQGQLLVTMDTSSIEQELDAQRQANEQLMSQGQGGGEPVEMTAASTNVKRMVDDARKTIDDRIKQILPGQAPAPKPAPAPEQKGPSREQIEKALTDAHEQGRAQGAQEAQAALQQQAQMGGGGGAGMPGGMSEEEAMAQQQALAEQEAMAQGGGMPGGAGADTSMLEHQVQDREVTSPINGVVTKIEAEEGSPARGALMTVADNSRYLIKTSVRESDIADVKEGNRVTFTTPVTGDREFEGKVRRVAPMADGGEDGGAAAAARAMQGAGGDGGSQDSKKDTGISFPVEIEVTGDTKGLRLGGSARVEIVTEEDRDHLSVPLDAVYDENKVLVLNRANQDATEGTIEERTVKTGVKNDTDIAVTSGDLKEGDVVIAWPEDFRDRVGETVSITDENFNPSGTDEKDGEFGKSDGAEKSDTSDKSDK